MQLNCEKIITATYIKAHSNLGFRGLNHQNPIAKIEPFNLSLTLTTNRHEKWPTLTVTRGWIRLPPTRRRHRQSAPQNRRFGGEVAGHGPSSSAGQGSPPRIRAHLHQPQGAAGAAAIASRTATGREGTRGAAQL